MSKNVPALVSWPSAPLTRSLVLSTLDDLARQETGLTFEPVENLSEPTPSVLLQWSTYDNLTHDGIPTHLSSSYIIRKALIRKHFMSRTIRAYLAKHPDSVLQATTPKTFELEIAFRDELDELWSDELYDLEAAFTPGKWWILKPGMADRGMGIRLFDNRETLEAIFDDFEETADDEDDDDAAADGTAVITSQLRHFVIQEYLGNPLLLDPRQVPLGNELKPVAEDLVGHKFHLRVYVLASSALSLYMFNHILALFSSKGYTNPEASSNEDLSPHLTNSCLQTDQGENVVRLFREFIGTNVLPGGSDRILLEDDVDKLVGQVAEILKETWTAALESPVHFQPLPNAFELFGVDFLVTHSPEGFTAHLLEINAEPAIEMTGPRLSWILEDMFKSIGRICVQPFFQTGKLTTDETWKAGETKWGFIKCLDVQVHGPGRG